MIYTIEGFNDNSAMSPNQFVTVKNPIARKPICQFLDTLEVKSKTAVRRFCANKSNNKAVRSSNMLRPSILKRRCH